MSIPQKIANSRTGATGQMAVPKNATGLDFDRSFVLVYDLPRFFYIHKDNIAAKNRIEKGLQMAFEDGSLKTLWEKYNRESIDYVELANRKVYHLDNPLLKGLKPSYRQYFFNPLTDASPLIPATQP
jgi:hypothetical protein